MESKEVKLIGCWASPFVRRVEWALKLKGIDYEYVEENLANKSPLLLQCNPIHKKVPVLIHNGKPVVESLVIIEYIDETWKGNPIMPNDPYERAMAHFWAKFSDEKLLGPISDAFISEGEEKEIAIELTKEAFKILDEELNGKKFFGGDVIGFVDLVVGWIPHWLGLLEEVGCMRVFDSEKFPSYSSWMNNFLNVLLIKENLPPIDDLKNFVHQYRQQKLAA